MNHTLLYKVHISSFYLISPSSFRCLRQFLDGGAYANSTLQRFFSSAVFKRAGYFFKTDYVKLMEGCIEAPFQLAIQLFAILAGSFPGKQLRSPDYKL